MHLRISEGQLRFRITDAELKALRKGDALTMTLPLGEPPLTCVIELAQLTESLMLDEQKEGWRLWVDESALAQFAASLPSREGIEQDITRGGYPLKLVLEVDIRRKKTA